jgi:hypothetical protein
MRNQRVMQVHWVRERYVPGVGATPPCRAAASADAALGAPTPGTPCTNRGPDQVQSQYQP